MPYLHAAEEESKRPGLDALLFDKELWTKPMADVKSSLKAKDPRQIEMAKQLKAQGHDVKVKEDDGFEWMSAAKEALRAQPGTFSLLDQKIGEVVLRGDDETAKTATVSVYNRGDDGEIQPAEYEKRFTDWKAGLNAKLGVRPSERSTSGSVVTDAWMWRKDDTAYLLEGSLNRSEKRPEFIRLRLASISKASKAPSKMARRNSFAANVQKDAKGFTWIDGIPMVDQGQKGYCVVATVERVARYFGAEIDQHELAQLANTGDSGTRPDEMEKAFQRVTGKIHLRTLALFDYDERLFEKDIRSYNRAAKSAGKPTFDYDPDEYIISPAHLWTKVDPPTFRDMKRDQNRFEHFERKIKEYVDQGIPLCWTLFLGMFPEEGLPQSFGGHMRMIFGYNFDSEDPAEHKIYYTDSWGGGHEKKVMRADEAYSMTTGLYTMVPNR